MCIIIPKKGGECMSERVGVPERLRILEAAVEFSLKNSDTTLHDAVEAYRAFLAAVREES